MKELPLACSLDAAVLSARLAEIASLGDAALLARERRDDGELLRFRADAETHHRLQAVVAAEAECCPFLQLEVSRDREALVLAISAPPGGARLAHELADAFGPHGGRPDKPSLVSTESDRASTQHETEGSVHQSRDGRR